MKFLANFMTADWWPTLRYAGTAWLIFAAGYFIKYGLEDFWRYLLFWCPLLLLFVAIVFAARSIWFLTIYRPGDDFAQKYEQFSQR